MWKMLKSPKELQATSIRAAEWLATKAAKSVAESEKLATLQKEFESACLDAALKHRTHIFFDGAISEVANLQGFSTEEVKRDIARQQFLESKIAETQKQAAQILENLTATYPALIVNPFPNHVAKDFRKLLDQSIKQTTAEDTTAFIKKQLCIANSISPEIWQKFEPDCLNLASKHLLLKELNTKRAKVFEINASIPSGLSSALKISWDAVTPSFGRANKFGPHKLKWISTAWPKLEAYFNADIENAASSGLTSKDWHFWSIQHCDEKDSFVVDTGELPKPDINSMSEEEQQAHFYWQEIKERDEIIQRYDKTIGALKGVHPLPVAEIFRHQGFKILIEELGEEDENGSIPTREISITDLDKCSVEFTYRLHVNWGIDQLHP